MELKLLVYKFGALTTHLANFREEVVRERYTQLNWAILAVAEKAATTTHAEYQAHFAKLDAAFTSLNDDCANAAPAPASLTISEG
jgi:hypothetical protein